MTRGAQGEKGATEQKSTQQEHGLQKNHKGAQEERGKNLNVKGAQQQRGTTGGNATVGERGERGGSVQLSEDQRFLDQDDRRSRECTAVQRQCGL